MKTSHISAKWAEPLRKQKFCVHIAKTRTSKMHGHDFLEFSYIQKGSIRHTFGREVEILQEGDYFIVDYGTRHQYTAVGEENPTVINLLFFPGFVDRTLEEQASFENVVNSYLVRFRYRSLNSSPAGKTFHDTDGSIYHILRRILREYEEKSAGYMEYIRCLMIEMLISIMRNIGQKEKSHCESGVISEITAYIQAHYAEHLRLSQIARRYNYSLSHISKKFTKETGKGFVEYLQHIRIEQSCKLLESNDLTIGEIAVKVGYNDIKFFNKIFREIVGVTPREFRKISK